MFDAWFWVWSILAVFLLISEIFTAGFFMLPFGFGAAVAALFAFLKIDPLWQTVAFIAVSTIAFVALRRVAETMTHEPPERMGADRLIGQQGVVIDEISPDHAGGRIRVAREEWRADAPGEGVVPPGTHVMVDAIEGTHLVVHSIQ